MDYRERFQYWKTDLFFDDWTKNELSILEKEADEKEIEDRFYRELEFGTGGLRGIMAAGTNRMNKYTVGKATAGLGYYLINKYGMSSARRRGIVIAYDTRNYSKAFAETAANVLTALNLKVYLLADARPTPQLSFSVQHLYCVAGIIITASHNPKEYNGYKVYDEHGCQMVPEQVKEVADFISAISDYSAVDFRGDERLKETIDTTDAFVEAVMRQSMPIPYTVKQALRVVYTPLHGTGNIPIRKALYRDGFTDVAVVEEQSKPDGNFPTVPSPNPEDHDALAMGVSLAQEITADIVLGSDPDSDRIGVVIRTAEGAYAYLTGNQIGALLMDFILTYKKLDSMKNPAVIKTIVTSELGAEIAKKHGIKVFSTLTGFKYIGEKITQFEGADEGKDYTFIFGYEESYGYLAGTHARDKDAVVASVLICEMAAAYKALGKTLADRLQELYEEYGYYLDDLESYVLKGKDGLQKIEYLMAELRNQEDPFEGIAEKIDYSKPVQAEPGFGMLPTSNALKYIFRDESWVAIRPSGTEPKIKIYYSMKADDGEAAKAKLARTKAVVEQTLGL